MNDKDPYSYANMHRRQASYGWVWMIIIIVGVLIFAQCAERDQKAMHERYGNNEAK